MAKNISLVALVIISLGLIIYAFYQQTLAQVAYNNMYQVQQEAQKQAQHAAKRLELVESELSSVQKLLEDCQNQ